MARKKNEKLALRQESIKTPASFDYEVKVIPFRDPRGNNRLSIESPG